LRISPSLWWTSWKNPPTPASGSRSATDQFLESPCAIQQRTKRSRPTFIRWSAPRRSWRRPFGPPAGRYPSSTLAGTQRGREQVVQNFYQHMGATDLVPAEVNLIPRQGMQGRQGVGPQIARINQALPLGIGDPEYVLDLPDRKQTDPTRPLRRLLLFF
jgi:hypothetical protein